MAGASKGSLQSAIDHLEASSSGAGSPSAQELRDLSSELFSVSDLLEHNIALRRALTDPGRSGDDRAGLATGLLSGQVSDRAAQVVAELARSRWSSPRDLVDASESLAAHAVVAAAEADGRLDAVEDDVFRFRRIVDGDVGLRVALTDANVANQRKDALLEQLIGTQVAPESLALIRRAFVASRGRGFDRVLDAFGEIAAARRDRLVARVTSAFPLADDERSRLVRALTSVYGREPHLDLEVQADVVGGLRVQVGDEVVDGTVASRLADARRRLAG